MITPPILINIAPIKFLSTDFFAQVNRFQHRDIGKSTPTNIIHFSCSWLEKIVIESIDKI
jgi:hypothetical protein